MQDRDRGRQARPGVTFRTLAPGETPVGPVQRVEGEIVGGPGGARAGIRRRVSRKGLLILAGSLFSFGMIPDLLKGQPVAEPSAQAPTEEPEPEPTPKALPEVPAAKPVPPDIGERKRDVEGNSEVPIVVGNDILKTIRKVIKPKYQGPANYAESHESDTKMVGLFKGITKRQLEAKATSQNTRGELERNLEEVPKYVVPDMSSVLWDLKLKKAIIPPSLEIDYESNKNLKPTKIQLSMMIPLNELQGIGLKVQTGRVEGKALGVVEMGQVPVFLREVISTDFIKPGTKVETMELERYVIVGKQTSDNASVEIVGTRDGRITVVIQQPSHKLRPGERSRAQLPPIPR